MVKNQGNTKGNEIADEDIESFLFLSHLIHDGYYNLRITWGEVNEVFGQILDEDPYQICMIVRDKGYTYGCEKTDPFMLLKEPKIRDEIIGGILERFFGILDQNPLSLNVSILSYTQRSLIMSILGSFYDHEMEFAKTTADRILIPIVTGEKFQDFGQTRRLIEERIGRFVGNLDCVYEYLNEPWFLEFVLILKNGYYGNGNFNYIDSLESSFRNDFVEGILKLINEGGLVSIILNFKKLLNDEKVNNKIRGFVKKSRDETKLRRFYEWLSIANDLAIGSEFLIGSIEFLPNGNELLGVFLFIAGSTQLLIRPLIEISKRAHLSKLYRKKIRF